MSSDEKDVRHLELPMRGNIDRDRLWEIAEEINAHTWAQLYSYVIVVPEGVAEIHDRDFIGVLWEYSDDDNKRLILETNVVAIELPDSLTEIPNVLFANLKTLTKITIGKGVTRIGADAFHNCRLLKTVIMRADKWELEIDSDAFGWCVSLESIEFPENLSSLGEESFTECVNLTEVTIPKNVSRIDDGVFKGCTGLKTVTISSDAGIPRECFKECSSLTNVNFIRHKIPPLGSNAFEGCTSLVVDRNWTGHFTSVESNTFARVQPFPLTLKDLSGKKWEVTNWGIPSFRSTEIFIGGIDLAKHVESCAKTQHPDTLGKERWNIRNLEDPTGNTSTQLITALALFEKGEWGGETELTNDWFVHYEEDEGGGGPALGVDEVKGEESAEYNDIDKADEATSGGKHIIGDGVGRASKIGKWGISFTDLAI